MNEEAEIRWYSARLLYKCTVESQAADLFEERFVVFRAREDRELVLAKLKALAESQQGEYRNRFGQPVRWRFQEVLEIQDVSGRVLGDGAEVFFRWWENPTDEDFDVLRQTHEEPWWQPDAPH